MFLEIAGGLSASLHTFPSRPLFFSLGYSCIVKFWALLPFYVFSLLWI